MEQGAFDRLLMTGILVMLRVSTAFVTMPIFSSPGIPVRMKALLVFIVVVLLTPVVAYQPAVSVKLSVPALLGEVVLGLAFGLPLAFLTEAVLFASSLMGGAFSFSLASLMDPNSHAETEVLGTVLNWMALLVLLSAGLHRTMLAALMRTFAAVPVGCAFLSGQDGMSIASMLSGTFLSGLQLAAPVVAAALLVEVAVGLISRMAPALPAQIASVPLKTIVSYLVLAGSLALWPGWIEQHMDALLNAAQRQVRP